MNPKPTAARRRAKRNETRERTHERTNATRRARATPTAVRAKSAESVKPIFFQHITRARRARPRACAEASASRRDGTPANAQITSIRGSPRVSNLHASEESSQTSRRVPVSCVVKDRMKMKRAPVRFFTRARVGTRRNSQLLRVVEADTGGDDAASLCGIFRCRSKVNTRCSQSTGLRDPSPSTRAARHCITARSIDRSFAFVRR